MLALFIMLMVIGPTILILALALLDKSKGFQSDNSGPLVLIIAGLVLFVVGTTSLINMSYYRSIALEQKWAYIKDGMFQWEHEVSSELNE